MILFVALVVMVLAVWKLVPILRDYSQSESAYRDLAGSIVDLGDISADEAAEEEDFFDWKSVSVDFSSLYTINPDVVGWIRFDDTDAVKVDYPILHASDNDTYLHTNLYGDGFSAGSIFLESADSSDFSDCYNIIYGHNMKNGSMFGTLKQYNRDADFYGANQYFTIYTPEAAYRYHIFAYDTVKDDSIVYTVGYSADESFQSLIDWIIAHSAGNTGIYPDRSDRIVTLSTCTSASDDERFIVCGVCVDELLY